MKALVALLLLTQLLNCKSIPVGPFQPLLSRVIDCDDPESEEAAAIAVDYINSHNLHGYKFALNSIEKIKVLPRRPTGELFLLELDLLQTECHIVNPLPAENCTVRPITDHVVEGECDVKLLKLDGSFSMLSRKCHSKPDSAEDIIQICPDCPLLAVLNDTRVINAVNLALAQYNGEHEDVYLRLVEIGRAQILHLPDSVSVEFAVVVTNCSGKDAQEHVDGCLPEDQRFGFCKASVLTEGNITVSCEVYGHQTLCLKFSITGVAPLVIAIAGVTHDHLTKEHLGGEIPSLSKGFKHHDLRHFHRGPAQDTSDSSSQEAPVATPPAAPVAKLPLCPGRIRHYQV
uniref:Alpha 2-HS glycoprotein n=1 Tax=Pelodiscus sinensis TaxID=13735 RepID=K7GGU6_PELSI